MTDYNERLVRLADSFHSLGECPRHVFFDGKYFDAQDFAEWSNHNLSSGGRDAALFILSVYNCNTDWSEWLQNREKGKFDMHDALGTWDGSHRKAFAAWVADPWWM